jgi:hypothetical protein
MSGAQKRTFELITEEAPVTPPAQPATPPADQTQAARQLLFTALRALSQRTLTAVTNLFSLFLVVLAFILFGRILDDPTPNRLTGVGGFAVFCLLIDVVRRRTGK